MYQQGSLCVILRLQCVGIPSVFSQCKIQVWCHLHNWIPYSITLFYIQRWKIFLNVVLQYSIMIWTILMGVFDIKVKLPNFCYLSFCSHFFFLLWKAIGLSVERVFILTLYASINTIKIIKHCINLNIRYNFFLIHNYNFTQNEMFFTGIFLKTDC